jgi:signal transduction histidine kinase
MPDRVLVGGILFNRNFELVDHLRQVIFPVGSLPDDAEGMTALHVGDTSVATSRQRLQGQREIGTVVDAEVRAAVLDTGRPWLGTREFGGISHVAGYEPLVDGNGRRVGMLMAAFPDGPYLRMTWVLLGMTAALLALTMLAISVVFLHAGRELSQRLAQIEGTMGAVRAGDRLARVGEPLRDDELGRLSRHFDELLATVAEQERSLEAQVQQRTRELHDRTEQLDAIFALSPDGLVSFDEHRRVRFANEAFAHMIGCEAALLLGLDEAELSAQLKRQGAAATGFPGVATLREFGEGVSFELRRPASRVLSARVQVASATHVSQVLYVRDVTHESEVDRMKSEFLTTAAHELRTPMTSIYGYVELLLARELPPARRRAVLDTVSRQSTLMMAIINQLLDLARIEARRGSDFELERLDLAAVAATRVADHRPPDGRQAPRVDAAAQPLPVRADAQKLQQALLNILSNAYKYSPAGGEVEIAFHRDERDGRVRHGVSVRDHGIGLSTEQRARVFERFYRADASGNIPGTGLGMSIVKEIVELHGGSVEIDSAAGEGTCMTVWLPAA